MASVRGAITTAEKKRSRPYTAKQKKFLLLYAKNEFKDVRECAAKAGYKMDYWTLVQSLKEDIKEIAESVLIGAAPAAAHVVADVLSSDKPLPNTQAKLQAAREVLDRAGVVKPDKHEYEHNIAGGLFLLPVKHVPVDIEAEEADYEYIESESE